MHVATTLTRNTRPRVDFVGHLGGDDFVLLLRSRDWSLRLQSLLDDLSVSLVNFHSPEHREAKQLVAHGRDGVLTSFPLLSVSVAAVEVTATSAATLESVADELRRTKGVAKARSGCSCMLSTGNRVVDLLAGVNLPALQDDTAQFRALG
jgi:GGDEF domain-containing protein